MAQLSAIEWTEATWNPIAGCTMVSPGCTNCYAMRLAARLQAMGHEKYQGTTRRSGGRHVWTGKVAYDAGALQIPINWRKPMRIFVNSMSDLFQEAVPLEFILRVFQTMCEVQHHTYQILTKRPERILELQSRLPLCEHIWLGTSVENADYKSRIDILRQVQTPIRFLSLEPLVGPLGRLDLRGIHWVIVGGESGPGARPIDKAWVRDIRRQCRDQDVAFFFKQWGGRNKKKSGRKLDGRTYDEYPAAAMACQPEAAD
jgi:protein gp37